MQGERTILDQDYVRPLPPMILAMLYLLVGIGGGVLMVRWGPLHSAALLVVTAAFWLESALLAFRVYNVILPLPSFAMLIFGVYIMGLLALFWDLGRRDAGGLTRSGRNARSTLNYAPGRSGIGSFGGPVRTILGCPGPPNGPCGWPGLARVSVEHPLALAFHLRQLRLLVGIEQRLHARVGLLHDGPEMRATSSRCAFWISISAFVTIGSICVCWSVGQAQPPGEMMHPVIANLLRARTVIKMRTEANGEQRPRDGAQDENQRHDEPGAGRALRSWREIRRHGGIGELEILGIRIGPLLERRPAAGQHEENGDGQPAHEHAGIPDRRTARGAPGRQHPRLQAEWRRNRVRAAGSDRPQPAKAGRAGLRNCSRRLLHQQLIVFAQHNRERETPAPSPPARLQPVRS